MIDLRLGDCREVMRAIPDASVDAIVTDPPYELGFMNKAWDSTGIAYDPEVWRQCLRVLKPGGHLVSFGGTRTYHRMVCAVEDAGFEVRDTILWLYGSGFPKSRNLEGQWNGWGTALKPAHEPAVLARKPFVGALAANVLTHGTGGINVDGCRIPIVGLIDPKRKSYNQPGNGRAGAHIYSGGWRGESSGAKEPHPDSPRHDARGRRPANVIHDGSKEVLEAFGQGYGDTGSAARFYYCAKASKSERAGNDHPTIKPLALMRYLCRLVTPPGGVVLDPFAGSGTTLAAAILEGFAPIGIEADPTHHAEALRRVDVLTSADTPLFTG